ncbi:hypothetical protein V8C86DRAFT_2604227 [Haematococcus lacustris]
MITPTRARAMGSTEQPAREASTPMRAGHDAAAVWVELSNAMKGHTQASADLLVRAATTQAEVDDFVRQLLQQLHARQQERDLLDAQLRRDRNEFTAQAKLLSHHFQTAQQRTSALQGHSDGLEAELAQAKKLLEQASAEREQLKIQVAEYQAQLASQSEARDELVAMLTGRDEVLAELKLAVEEQRQAARTAQAAKAALQTQLKGMVAAEQELTVNLKATHAQIEEQLHSLRTQLKDERQRRLAVAKKKAELAQQVSLLGSRLAALAAARDVRTPAPDQDLPASPPSSSKAMHRQTPSTRGRRPAVKLSSKGGPPSSATRSHQLRRPTPSPNNHGRPDPLHLAAAADGTPGTPYSASSASHMASEGLTSRPPTRRLSGGMAPAAAGVRAAAGGTTAAAVGAGEFSFSTTLAGLGAGRGLLGDSSALHAASDEDRPGDHTQGLSSPGRSPTQLWLPGVVLGAGVGSPDHSHISHVSDASMASKRSLHQSSGGWLP